MSILAIALWIGIPLATVFAVLVIGDKALAAYAKRREGASAEFVLWVEEGPA